MSEKPTYEKLEKKIQELEQLKSEQAQKLAFSSEARPLWSENRCR